MDCNIPGLTVHHQLPEFTQIHVHWISDATQPSHPVIPFSSHLQSFPASGSFQICQFFTSDSQSIGASVSASVLPMNIQDWFPLEWTGWMSLQSKGLSRVFSNTTIYWVNLLIFSSEVLYLFKLLTTFFTICKNYDILLSHSWLFYSLFLVWGAIFNRHFKEQNWLWWWTMVTEARSDAVKSNIA